MWMNLYQRPQLDIIGQATYPRGLRQQHTNIKDHQIYKSNSKLSSKEIVL